MKNIFRDTEQKVKNTWVKNTNFTPEAQKLFNNPAMMRVYLDVTEAKGKRWFWAGAGAMFIVYSFVVGLAVWIF